MASNSPNLLTTNEDSNQMRIIDADTHKILTDFITNYSGLPIDCEMELRDNFPNIHRLTLKAILETEFNNRMRVSHWRYEANMTSYLQKYETIAEKNPTDSTILLNIAKADKVGPVMMCRTFLKFKYNLNKVKLSKLIRYPHLIEDPLLSANVTQCLCSDSQDGSLVDLRRRILGEEYEFKLKRMAKEAGMHFNDEKDLRRLGYDKTPDIKMILPFLYKGEVINWIESKAIFGDIKTHKRYIQQQLNSYCNRFGAGITIYWFGYHESTPNLPDNSIGIIVLDDFPSPADIDLLDLSKKPEIQDSAVREET